MIKLYDVRYRDINGGEAMIMVIVMVRYVSALLYVRFGISPLKVSFEDCSSVTSATICTGKMTARRLRRRGDPL